ncbi:uncharacterized protein EDB91DRAFT_855954 [Suillus paluster]|uniref:uncharacterized protein n=1 Tax=Suillus paluster TaxID=48578 RepID=UPI001B876485|nr:uncharacterized protein EDB91DRAFT_855954 [Suillus paluster]KAG1728520.1 hypothetical protein EDB91DRAFT_855954 [Suillus paluster]
MAYCQLSDRIGRKPLILTALFTIAVTMLSFGLSRSFLGLLVSRVICGAFNGQYSVTKSMVMDITDATNLANAYGYMPLPWMSAAVIGGFAGGSLSRPADRFPEIFGQSELLKTYPYLLSCAVPAFFASTAWLLTCFYLKERFYQGTSLGADQRMALGTIIYKAFHAIEEQWSDQFRGSKLRRSPIKAGSNACLADSKGPAHNSKLWHHGTVIQRT